MKKNATLATSPNVSGSRPEPVDWDGKDLKIDPFLHAILPPQTSEEAEELKANLERDGCRDPIVLWDENDTIVDGHHRYEMCRENGNPFKVLRLSFKNREEAMTWMLSNQLGRRNLGNTQGAYLRGKLYEASTSTKTRAAARKKEARMIAATYNVDEKTVERNGKFAKALDRIAEVAGKDLLPELLASKITVDWASDLAELDDDKLKAAMDRFRESGKVPKTKEPKAKPSALEKLETAWEKADEETRKAFLKRHSDNSAA